VFTLHIHFSLPVYEKAVVAQNELNFLLKNKMYKMSQLQLIQLKMD
jgi:hypothetical protein